MKNEKCEDCGKSSNVQVFLASNNIWRTLCIECNKLYLIHTFKPFKQWNGKEITDEKSE